MLKSDPQASAELVARLRCVPRFVAAINERWGGLFGEHDLADLTQETATVAWRKKRTFRGDCALESWLYGIALFEFRNAARRRMRRPPHESLTAAVATSAPHHDIDAMTNYDDLRRKLDTLPKDQAVAIRLRHFEHLTFADIGARLGVPPETVKTRYYRGIRTLQQRLKGE